MKTFKLFCVVFIAVVFLPIYAYASGEVPYQVNYQGYIKSGGSPYNGTGYFKFSIIDSNTSPTINYWTNDSSSVAAGSAPTASVSTTVSNGVYNIVLGDTSITNMTAIDSDTFTNSATYLRVWFSTTGSSFTRLTTGRRFVSVPYAYAVEIASSSGLEYDTDLGGLKIADGGVTSTFIENGAITNDDINGSADISASKVSGTAATLTGTQSFDSGTLYVDSSSNRVGIGTESPSYPLHVYKNYGDKTGTGTDYGLYVNTTTGTITESGDYSLFNYLCSAVTGASEYSIVAGATNYGYSSSSSSDNQDALIGGYNLALLNNASGNVDNAYGTYSQSTPTLGSIDNAFAYYGRNFGPSSSITNGYGLWYDGSDDAMDTSWGIYITGEDQNYISGKLGIGNETTVAKLEVDVGESDDVVGIYLDANDVDKIALDIDASQTTVDIIDIDADTVLSGNVMDVTADSLTGGSILNLYSDSADTTSRYLVNIVNDSTLSSGSCPLYIRQDSTRRLAFFDRNCTSTTGATEYGIYLSYLDSGVVTTGTDTNKGYFLEVDRNGATGGTITNYALDIDAASNPGADSGTHYTYGVRSVAAGTGEGTSTTIGGYFSASGADSNYGLLVANGEVGIGTTTPDTLVELSKDSASTTITVSSYHNTEETTPTLTLRKADGSEGSPGTVDVNAILGTINFNGYDDDSFDTGGCIYAKADATWGASERGTEMYFQTRDGSGSLTDQMVIEAGGNVGIGPSLNPTILLHAEDSRGSLPVGYFNNTSSSGSVLKLTTTSTSEYNYLIDADSNNGSTDCLLVLGNANVCIGTDNYGADAAGVLSIANGTAPTDGYADLSMLYAKDNGGSSEMWVMDEAGNDTQISPHDPETGDWIFYSKNVKTGRVVRVNMEKLVAKIEEVTGENFMDVWYE